MNEATRTFQRDDSGKIPGTWGKMNRHGSNGENYQIIICCPQCGNLSWLPHEIARDGTIKGSLRCQHCDYHVDEIKLEGF